MNTVPSIPGTPSWTHELDSLRNHWCWFMALGIAMIVFGTIAIGSGILATLAATVVFGFLLIAGGVATIISSFYAGRWSGMLLHLLIGVLYTVVGLMIINRPAASAIELTLIIAFFLIFGGIFRVVYALAERFTGWGWVLLNGGVSLLLGLLVYKQWPSSGLWLIGLFVGIELIFNGWAWVMLSFGLRPKDSDAKSNALPS